MIAALYVDTARGPYARMRGVECWGYATRDGRQLDALAPTRDARDYAGPWPVVAHPPCGPWGRFRRRYLGGEGDRECALVAVDLEWSDTRWGTQRVQYGRVLAVATPQGLSLTIDGLDLGQSRELAANVLAHISRHVPPLEQAKPCSECDGLGGGHRQARGGVPRG